MESRDDLKQAVASFVEGYSIEITPHDADKLPAIAEALKPGTSVYVANLPGVPLDTVVKLSGRVKQLGFNPVPHIVARRVESLDELDRALAELQSLGVNEALVIGGDVAAPKAPFDSSAEVLQTGLFAKHGFRAVGVAGHPEGSKAIGEARVEKALRDKAELAKTAGFEIRIVTQFGFDPEAVTEWEARTTAEGIALPIRVGMPGPASLRQLARFAMVCGIGSSARMLMTRTGATANLLRTQAPDELVTHLAKHRAQHPSSRLKGTHFFCFGGVVKTANWANAVAAGQFELNAKATGFEVR
ncbi:MAG TPA: methylenetetrahydrofolate reductase [Gammaproteobacteria bacterium]|nr:methylenetetrahydrofolate reductase [Gammaproteobacteria bacterium]